MATNPRIPDENDPSRRGPTLVPKAQMPRSAVPGVVLAIITAALILAAVLYFMPRVPKRGTPPAAAAESPVQPVPGQLQFSAMNMTPDPTGRAVALDGLVTNNSREMINGIMAQVQFRLKNGQTVNVNAPVSAIDLGAHKGNNGARINANPQNLTTDPIQPGQERGIVINVNQVPDGWDRSMPGIKVLTTTGAAAPVKNR
jgi:hypothetical protein